MKTNKPILLTLGAVLIAASAGLLIACAKPEPVQESVVRPIKLHQVEDRQSQDLLRFPARIAANEQAEISFRISGELTEFPVRSGARVEKDDLLAHLDDRDIKNEVAARQADYDLAKANFERTQSLLEKKMASQADNDSTSAQLKSAEVALQLAKDRLSDTVLKAPFTGRIARTLVENYQSVVAQQPILILQDVDTLEVVVQVPERIFTQVREDRINPDYSPFVTFTGQEDKEYTLTYKEHATEVTPGTQSYAVTYSLPKPEDLTVFPGMGATLTVDMARQLISDHNEPEFLLPVTAVLEDATSGQLQVWVYDEEAGVVQPQAVSVGRITQSGVTITSGVNNGDRIAAAGLSQLRPGMSVKPLERERGI
ncbi:MAG: efflux RND transporter periplasmic adaptor subunit [Gammaproteobacteria bacterium]|nr:efflux RND transporter periplasmic adaptor subunit [Gammaproteobacteria bacterium]MBT8076039.1 efflux RND transporter periplasmic adaptor subunit [Gammaproteobacteria bacterium]MBT8329160.1 efflux RND transporter periplasmic adaptor subunit [Desulfofustis sp.]NNK97745.1 efflux RND transporter periplasmic adaptor subunit [Xanthomonadales bacterium]